MLSKFLGTLVNSCSQLALFALLQVLRVLPLVRSRLAGAVDRVPDARVDAAGLQLAQNSGGSAVSKRVASNLSKLAVALSFTVVS